MNIFKRKKVVAEPNTDEQFSTIVQFDHEQLKYVHELVNAEVSDKVFDILIGIYKKDWVKTANDDTAKREDLHRMVRAVKDFRSAMKVIANNYKG